MGTKTTGNTDSTTTRTPTPEETEMQKAQLAQYKAYEPGQTQMFQNAFAMGNKLLTSFGNSDQWNTLIGGVTDKQTRNSINLSDRGLRTQGQSSGILDSGTMASGRMRAGADLANSNAQFNVGALQNALNLAFSGQAQVQQPANTSQNTLATQLAGLRTTRTTGNQAQYGMNPFLMSMASAGGNSLGGGNISASYCWVAAEIFDGWDKPKTNRVRYYIGNIAPTWFRKFYLNNGKAIAKFIHNKPILKLALRPLFECFAIMGKKSMEGALA